MFDVIVVGAGPAGSYTAYRLAKMGLHVIVLEKRPEIGLKTCCTGIVSQECAARFKFPDSIVHGEANSASIISPAGKALQISRPQPTAVVVDRPALDRHLAELAKKAGVMYYLRRKAEYISQRPEKVVLGIKDEGCDYQFEARALVLANGFNSRLAYDVGLGRPGYIAGAAQAEVALKGAPGVVVQFGRKVAPGFFAWLVPTAAGKGLAGLIAPHSAGHYLAQWTKTLAAQQKIESNSAGEIAFAGIPLKPLAHTFTDRVLVVGDAAGQVKPTTGGGIYFGLLAAEFAADTLHKGLVADDLSSRSLAAYERNWRKKLGGEIRREYYARKFFERLSDAQIEKLFTTLQSSGLVDSLLADEDLSFDWHGDLLGRALKLGFQKLLPG